MVRGQNRIAGSCWPFTKRHPSLQRSCAVACETSYANMVAQRNGQGANNALEKRGGRLFRSSAFQS